MQYQNTEFWIYYNIGYIKRWSDILLRNINSHKFICVDKISIDNSDFVFKIFICEICNINSFNVTSGNDINMSCAEFLIKKMLE